MKLTTCVHCHVWINPELGSEYPAAHQGHSGTKDDPRAPGDYDNICDVCNYGKGLQGGPGQDYESIIRRHNSQREAAQNWKV